MSDGEREGNGAGYGFQSTVSNPGISFDIGWPSPARRDILMESNDALESSGDHRPMAGPSMTWHAGMKPPIDPFAALEFESAAHLTLTLLSQVRDGRMTPIEFATWLRQLMMHKHEPLSDNEKSAMACTLAVALLDEEGLDLSPSELMELLDNSEQAGAIGRLV